MPSLQGQTRNSWIGGGRARACIMAPFNPQAFFRELPRELTVKILNFACNTRMYSFSSQGAREIHRVGLYHQLETFESDLRTLNALRATNKGRPVIPHLAANRYQYYRFVLEVWAVRRMVRYRERFSKERLPGLSQRTLNSLYGAQVQQERTSLAAIRHAANKDPEAMKRALQGIRCPVCPFNTS